MLCKQLVKSKGTVHPCGQCLFCRINKKRDWISRLLLEAASHEHNQFWTLTYEDTRIPNVLAPNGQSSAKRQAEILRSEAGRKLAPVAAQSGTLFKPDLALFFKRFRKNFGDIRYYAVGEYGEKRGRPHYHVLAFGVEVSEETLQETWKLGAVHIGDVESASITYCVEYALKKEKSHDLIDLRRHPEFAVMSTKPAIGSYAIGEFRTAILNSKPLPTGELLIPDTFRLLGRDYPVPRFIRNELEEEGFISARSAVGRYLGDSEVMSALLARSKVAKEEFEKYKILWSQDPVSENQARSQVLKQKLLNAESRQRIFGVRHETL